MKTVWIMKWYLVLAASFISMTLMGQERQSTVTSPVTKRHSVELYAGVPNILVLPIDPGRRESNAVSALGQKDKSLFPLGINLAYSFRITKRWELQALVHVGGWFYERYQYPASKYDPDGFNWTGKPEKLYTSVKGMITPVLSARYYWYLGATTQWYSSIGVAPFIGGVNTFPIIPNVTPIGLHAGSGRWYFLAEISGVATGMGILAGAGFRM